MTELITAGINTAIQEITLAAKANESLSAPNQGLAWRRGQFAEIYAEIIKNPTRYTGDQIRAFAEDLGQFRDLQSERYSDYRVILTNQVRRLGEVAGSVPVTEMDNAESLVEQRQYAMAQAAILRAVLAADGSETGSEVDRGRLKTLHAGMALGVLGVAEAEAERGQLAMAGHSLDIATWHALLGGIELASERLDVLWTKGVRWTVEFFV